MSKADNEDILMYYQRLRKHPDMCQIKGDRDIMIRNLLIQAVTDEKALALISELQRIPTAEDVLTKVIEAQRELKVWERIIPYLSLVDIFNLSECGARFTKLVDNYT